MNWDQIEGQWHQVTGQIKSQWAKLTDDDLQYVAGKKDQLVGKLQQHYGILKEEAETQIDKWVAKIHPSHGDHSTPVDKATRADNAPPGDNAAQTEKSVQASKLS